jgi:hypothetical protein
MAESKKTRLLERIDHLSAQIDFLTEERMKLIAEQTNQQNLINQFRENILPNIILLQSLILSWFKSLNTIDQKIMTNIETKMNEKFIDLEKIFMNFLGILQLRFRISQNEDESSKIVQSAQFEENLFLFNQSRLNLKHNLTDELLYQYNLAIDDATIEFQQQFQEIIKLLDAFQINITPLHSLIPLDIISQLDESPAQIQFIEDQIEKFRKPIHFNGEPIIQTFIENFDEILNQIIANIDNMTTVSEDPQNFMNERYEDMQNLQENFLDQLWHQNSDVIYDLLDGLNEKIDKFIRYLNSIFDSTQSLQLEINPELNSHITTIDTHMEELIDKVQHLKDELIQLDQ